jgi:hypothetical protein
MAQRDFKESSGLIMIAKTFQNLIQQLTPRFASFALINNEGQLLFSKDSKADCLTTTRLVAFQIIKKYLSPQPLDLFILNDPENGGFSLVKIIFMATLQDNLHLVWDEELDVIDFKIPPTPLFERGQKNSFVWNALVEGHPSAELLKNFFEGQKKKIDDMLTQKDHLQLLSLMKNQQAWLKASQEIFDLQFANKALGSAESSYRTPSQQLIKLKLSIEERQNLKSITLDFTNTSLAADYSAASHVVESGLIQKLLQFYQIENFFSQVILDKIKIILPPKSIVSKAQPRGDWNNEIQSICSQLCAHNLAQLNTQTRKSHVPFELSPELRFDFVTAQARFAMCFDQKTVNVEGIETLTTQGAIRLLECHRSEQNIRLKFEVTDSQASLHTKTKIFAEAKDYAFKINDRSESPRKIALKPLDQVQVIWRIG